MTQILSNSHIDCIIDQTHRVVGLADEERPYEFSDGSGLNNLVRSQADGGLYGSTNAAAILGGEFTIRLAPNSPSANWFITQKAIMKRAVQNAQEVKRYSISFSDPAQGRATRMEGCILDTCPDQVEAGQAFEVMFVCELIIPDNAAGTFRAPFDSGAPAAAAA